MTASSYPDDGVGEVFLKLGKQGSTLAGVMDAFSMAISVGPAVRHPAGVLRGQVHQHAVRAGGITDDSDIRMASSVMDYIFRRLALDHLSYEERSELGILTTAERSAALSGEDPAASAAEDIDPVDLAQSAQVEDVQPRPAARDAQAGTAPRADSLPQPRSSTELIDPSRAAPPTRRCASPAAPRCARRAAATSAKAAAQPAAVANQARSQGNSSPLRRGAAIWPTPP